MRGARSWIGAGLASTLAFVLAHAVAPRPSAAGGPVPLAMPMPNSGGLAVRDATSGFAGAGRCAAAACHGSTVAVPGSNILRNEHATWLSQDPHARAFETLASPLSESIVARLRAGPEPFVPASRDARCLACHATTARASRLPDAAADLLQEGVGCEACHGPAERWLAPHATYAWDGLPEPVKEEAFGMVRTKDLARRARACAGCHVGEPGREVNHDLIAAGHPALKFEFSAYLANLPAHWVEKGRNAASDFPARAWALGQASTARTALELLRSRASAAIGSPDRWPEFSEYECASCHRDLGHGPGSRPPSIGKPVWGTWYYPMAEALASDGPGHAPSAFPARLAALRTAMREPVPDAAPVARRADETLRALAGWLGALQAESFPPPKVETLIGAVNRPAPGVRTGRDFDAQRYLALVPLRQALTGPERDRPDLLNAIYGLRDRLNPPSPLTIGPGTAPDATQPRGPAPTAPLSSSQ